MGDRMYKPTSKGMTLVERGTRPSQSKRHAMRNELKRFIQNPGEFRSELFVVMVDLLQTA